MKERFDKETLENLESISNYLKEKYGEVKPEWKTIIGLLGDNLTLYNKCKQTLEEVGVYDKETGRKNGLLSTCKDLQATILKQIQHLGISPYASSKIKLAEEDSDDFIENLTN